MPTIARQFTIVVSLAMTATVALPMIACGADVVVDFRGSNPGDQFGWSVARAGDVNGDGLADVIVGAPSSDAPDDWAGRCYLFLGAFEEPIINAAQADAAFSAENFGDNLGVSVASAGDINDDGFDDVMMGARGNDGAGIQAGRVYLFHGPVSGTRQVTQAAAIFSGEAFDEVGWSLAGGFDLNDDGQDDIAMGAPQADLVGRAHVFFGPVAGNLSTTSADLTITGVDSFELLGKSLAAGDLNGDGVDDLAIGAPESPIDETPPGRVYVFFGPVAGNLPANAADVIIEGEGANDAFGEAVAVGDVSGDGVGDLIVGADQFFTNRGEGLAYVFCGPLGAGFHLANIADAVLVADSAGDVVNFNFGAAVASVGDINGDGLEEVVVGDPSADVGGPFRNGQAYLFLGPLAGAIPASQADIIFTGGPEDSLGHSLASLADTDANCADDFFLGGPDSAYSKTEGGRALLVQPATPGDLDQDRDVDLADVAALVDAIAGPQVIAPEGDVDRDLDTDLRDFSIVQRRFGQSCS